MTAVQHIRLFLGSKIHDNQMTISVVGLFNLLNEAKKMELEQLEEAYKKGFNNASPSSNEFGSISIGKF